GMRRCFFFQAEDGIRVRNVTGVQTCALPILFQPYSSAPLALYAAKLVSYSQGFDEIAKGADEYGWNITLGDMAAIWREGCIIRARFLDRITEAYDRNPGLSLLLSDEYFTAEITKCIPAWRRIVAFAAARGYPVPVFASTLSYYDSVRAERLPAALVQAQRDYFGAHTYQRVDAEGTFHVEWTQD